jgi:hypothetical protein
VLLVGEPDFESAVGNERKNDDSDKQRDVFNKKRRLRTVDAPATEPAGLRRLISARIGPPG